MTSPNAKVILDSISPEGDRLTTMEVVMHRFVLSEFNTHRSFSRNSASSRAIPTRKQMARVETETAFPVSWPCEQPGMQGGEELDGNLGDAASTVWRNAMQDAVRHATALAEIGVHKSVVNRLLEPFMWHTVIVSSTEWENFFGLRCNSLAQPEIRVAADVDARGIRSLRTLAVGAGGVAPSLYRRGRLVGLRVQRRGDRDR